MKLQHFIAALFKKLLKAKYWFLLILFSILVKWYSLYPDRVELDYSQLTYPYIGFVMRSSLGWVPFSIGDFLYMVLILLIVIKTVRFLIKVFTRTINRAYFTRSLQQLFFSFLTAYVIFNIFWGLNYNRKGIGWQMGLNSLEKITKEDVSNVAVLLHKKLISVADTALNSKNASLNFNDMKREADKAYRQAERKYPHFRYRKISVKKSIYSYLLNYVGTQGYFNPFTGEAQINYQVPYSLKPFVVLHEMAHQLGYARENEANFVAYLAGKDYTGNKFLRYSVYMDIYLYAFNALQRTDSAMAIEQYNSLPVKIKHDIQERRRYFKKYENKIEPFLTFLYDGYLKANNQPEGMGSYGKVVDWLVLYAKKYGIDAL